MKDGRHRNTIECFWLICLAFFWTSSGYLAWLHRLTDFLPGRSVDLATEVVGYLFQAAGLLLYAVLLQKHFTNRKRLLAGIAAADVLCIAFAVWSGTLVSALVWGYAMNLLHGLTAGYYLEKLAALPDRGSCGLAFGAGYAIAGIGTWLLTLPGGHPFIASRPALGIYGAAAAVSVALAGVMERHGAAGIDLEVGGSAPEEKDFRILLVLAGTLVFLLSCVKSFGFSFPAEEVTAGISLEASRVFYALGLMLAGFINDRSRRLGAVCCLVFLCLPFIMIGLTGRLVLGRLLWSLNYLYFAFYAVYRVLLFSDFSRRKGMLFLSGFGLMIGRVGDAAGAWGSIALRDQPVVMSLLASLLFGGAVLAFLRLYSKIYFPHAGTEETAVQAIFSAAGETDPQQTAFAPEKVYGAEDHVNDSFNEFADCYQLSGRERDVMRLILAGRSNTEIADILFVSESTVKFHMHNLLKKTGCENRNMLAALCRKYRSSFLRN